MNICETCKYYETCKEDYYMILKSKPIYSAIDDVTYDEAMADIDNCEAYESNGAVPIDK